jgi:hypothetical protein
MKMEDVDRAQMLKTKIVNAKSHLSQLRAMTEKDKVKVSLSTNSTHSSITFDERYNEALVKAVVLLAEDSLKQKIELAEAELGGM